VDCKALSNHPHLNPLPSRERSKKFLLPWREKVRMRGNYRVEPFPFIQAKLLWRKNLTEQEIFIGL
jgi:hypothetical protein